MTRTWDELWETMPVVVYGLRGGKSTHVDWLNKVKAEGDRLQKEGLEHHAIAVAYYEKLEAIKKLVEQDLPQIIMTHYFRRRFYELTDFPIPDWFKKAMEVEDEHGVDGE